MTLTNTQKAVTTVVIILASFAGGRYSVSQPKVQTVVGIKKDVKTDTDKDEHKKVVIVTVKETTGKTTTTETITDNTQTDTVKIADSQMHIDQTITPQETGKLSISALISNDFSKGIINTVYGVSVDKEVLGPITLGAWGLTSGVLGLSVGLRF